MVNWLIVKSEDFWRRLFGTSFIVAAAVMLICGETLLKPLLSGLGYILYWLGCFALTALAMITALVDFHITRERTRAQQRDLLKNAFGDFDAPESDDRQHSGKNLSDKKSN